MLIGIVDEHMKHILLILIVFFGLLLGSAPTYARVYFNVSFSTGLSTPNYSASYRPISYPLRYSYVGYHYLTREIMSPPGRLYQNTYIPQAIAYGETQKIKWLYMQKEPRMAIPVAVYPEPMINAPGVTQPITPYQVPKIPEKKQPEIKGPTIEINKLNEV